MGTVKEHRPMLAALKAELEQGEPMETTMRGAVAIAADTVGEDGLSWIEVMPVAEKAKNGNWLFTITADDLDAAAEYIKSNAQRIPIDYDHAGAEGGSTKAAGWFTGEAEVRGESLWAQVKWTPAAVQEIRDGTFRFISPEWEMQNRDPKTGLLTKFKELAAATLTNRPFFKEMAPVTAVKLEAGEVSLTDEDRDTILAALEAGEDVATILAATWTTAYVNNLPDSAFLYIEPGGTKDADGKTEPRSLRHFEVRDANGDVDPLHVRDALGRIPQSSVPADAKAEATAAAERLLKDAGGNPSAADQGTEDEPQEATVADEQPVTDYMKALGLDETVDPKHRLAAAFREKDEKILALTQEVTELTAAGAVKASEAEELTSRIDELEQKDRKRDIAVLLTTAVSAGRVFPAEKETLAELFANDVDGLRKMIATRPAEMFAGDPKGGNADPDRFADEPDVAAYAKTLETDGDPIDTEQAKVHLTAMQILKDADKADTYTTDEYVEAYTQAQALVR